LLREESNPHAQSGIDIDNYLTAAQPDAPSGVITIPDAHLLFHGDFKRVADHLKITDDTGKTFTVPDYFKTDHRAALFSPDGAQLNGEIVAALAGPLAAGQYAQAAAPVSDALASGHAIGRVATLQGSATAVRNGVAVTLNVGDSVYKGDVVQTSGDSALGVIFTDGTTFNLSSNARMVLNEFVYDPNGTANSAAISLVQGTISFLAGQVAKTGDMKVGTPVATMGIRGTAVNVTISADNGATNISVMAEADNVTHTVAVYALPTPADLAAGNAVGALLGTVTSNNGVFTFNPTPAGVVVQETAKDIGTVQKELAIVQQVFQTQAVGQQFLQGPGQPDTKTAQTATGTQFLVTDHSSTHDSTTSDTASGPTTIKVVIGDIGDNADTGNATTSSVVHLNHAPVANADDNGVVAAGIKATNLPFTGTPTATGNVLSNDTDEDQGDTHTVISVTAVSAHLHGVLTLGSDGTYTYTLDNTSALTKQLAVGETAQDIFSYTMSDQNGATSSSTLTITVTGTNDAPVIAVTDKAEAAAITEQPFQTGLITPDVQTGTIHFTDVDLSDRPTATITGQTITYLAADGHTVLTLTPTELSDIEAAFTIAGESVNANDGTIDWTYSIQDRKLDFLAKDETVTLTSTVLVDDHNGGTDTSTVTVTITGTDDVPVVGAPIISPYDKVETGTVTELANTTGALTLDQALGGTIHFIDSESTDRPTATIDSSSAVYRAAPGTTTLALTAAQLAALTLAFVITPEAGNTNDDAIDWTYKIADKALDFLAAGETVVVTSIVLVNDHNGGTDTSTVTVTVTGTNDAPVLAADASGANGSALHAITELAGTTGDTLDADITTGTLAFTDVDLTDSHTVSQAAPNFAWSDAGGNPLDLTTAQQTALATASTLALSESDSTGAGSGSIGFSYSAADSSFDFLAAGETLSVTYNVTVTDNNGLTSTQPVTVTVTGTNDAPTITASNETNVTAGNGPTPITPAATVTDVDSADFNGGLLVVSLGDSGTTGDMLTVINEGTDPGQIGLNGTHVTYGGVEIAAATGGANGADLAITFTSADVTPNVAKIVLDHVAFSAASDAGQGTRQVTYTLDDGDGGNSTGTATATITVAAAPPPPPPTDYWIGTDPTGDWSDAANWSFGAPQAGDIVIIDAATNVNYDVVGNASVFSLFVGADAQLTLEHNNSSSWLTVEELTTASGSEIILKPNTALVLSGSVDNAGAIAVDQAGNAPATADLKISGDTTLTGGGQILLEGPTDRIVSYTPGVDVTLTNVDNLISGAGQFGDGFTLVNQAQGVINATGTIIVDTGSHVIVNNGLLETTGGLLDVKSEVDGTGHITVNGGALELEMAVGSETTVTLAANTYGKLNLDDPANFHGNISGFAAGDVIHLNGVQLATGTFAGGMLTIAHDSGATPLSLNLDGNYTSDNFFFTADGTGGTNITFHDSAFVAQDDYLVMAPDSLTGGFDIPAFIFTANDTIPDSSTSIVASSQLSTVAANGEQSSNVQESAGGIVYFAPSNQPNPNSLQDSFTYKLATSSVDHSTATVSIDVQGPADANAPSPNVHLVGAQGGDVLFASQQVATMTGASGADTFVFGPSTGTQTISNFETAFDRVEINGTEFGNFTTLQNINGAISQHGADTIIHVDNSSITLANVTATDLTDANFVFHQLVQPVTTAS
jgi:VCBS repeat-containing protein